MNVLVLLVWRVKECSCKSESVVMTVCCCCCCCCCGRRDSDVVVLWFCSGDGIRWR